MGLIIRVMVSELKKKKQKTKKLLQLGMVAYIFNPSTQEAEAGKSL